MAINGLMKKYIKTKFTYNCISIFIILWDFKSKTRIPTWIISLIIVSLNLFINLACIAIALRFIFIFSIWSFVSEYVIRWQQGKNGKEVREDTVFCLLVLRFIFDYHIFNAILSLLKIQINIRSLAVKELSNSATFYLLLRTTGLCMINL